ncbi:SCO3374 family protein, partial [Streptomyces chartreusis]|uniref:SCO3374 family protein n=1 Tax=Streptomyces chartreusis TaxID=1969 RepID=UPI000262F3ED
MPGDPLRLVVGVRYDVLDVPAEAGHAALRRLAPGSPVAVRGDRMRLLVAAGTAEELPGLLEWLEWGTLPLDLTAIGAGGTMEAPRPPGMDTPLTPERGERLCQGAGGALPHGMGASFCRGTHGSVSGERGGALPCETEGSSLLREAGGSVSGERGGTLPCECGGTLPCRTDASLLREAGGTPPCERGGAVPGETDALLPRGTEGSMRRETGGLSTDEWGGMLPSETEASLLREAGGSVSGEAGGS